ncbi:hypothetical protein V8C42DRAFT_107590 [Trichoderma barbatum]
MELLEGFMAHKYSFHPANVPGYSSSQCQALDTGTEGPGRWYGGMAYPFLYPFPASISRLLRRRFQNAQARFYSTYLSVQFRPGAAHAGSRPPTGDSAAMKWRQIGQPLSVESALLVAAASLVLPHAGSASVRAGIRWHRRPMPPPGTRSMLPCRRSVVLLHNVSAHLTVYSIVLLPRSTPCCCC